VTLQALLLLVGVPVVADNPLSGTDNPAPAAPVSAGGAGVGGTGESFDSWYNDVIDGPLCLRLLWLCDRPKGEGQEEDKEGQASEDKDGSPVPIPVLVLAAALALAAVAVTVAVTDKNSFARGECRKPINPFVVLNNTEFILTLLLLLLLLLFLPVAKATPPAAALAVVQNTSAAWLRTAGNRLTSAKHLANFISHSRSSSGYVSAIYKHKLRSHCVPWMNYKKVPSILKNYNVYVMDLTCFMSISNVAYTSWGTSMFISRLECSTAGTSKKRLSASINLFSSCDRPCALM
jgi:hypothetical protein